MAGRTGFRVDLSKLRRKLHRVKQNLVAEEFRPELMDFTRRSLVRAQTATPVRDEALIRTNQAKQYKNRINAIPSIHTLENPSLRVKDNGEHWMFLDGKWYLANRWNLNAHARSAYDDLLSERERRMSTEEETFITRRAKSRTLYRKSWSQVGESLGLRIRRVAGTTRRKPPVDPPAAYGQWRGGKKVLSVVIYNPFLETPSRYKDFTGRELIGDAMRTEQPKFQRAFKRALNRRLNANFQ